MNKEAHETIAAIATIHASTAGGASQAASAVIECICGAATPLISNLFQGGTLQERLLFTLVLAGACTTMDDNSNKAGYGFAIDVNPQTLSEAFSKFTNLTGSDIRPHLPKAMVDFAARHSQHNLH